MMHFDAEKSPQDNEKQMTEGLKGCAPRDHLCRAGHFHTGQKIHTRAVSSGSKATDSRLRQAYKKCRDAASGKDDYQESS